MTASKINKVTFKSSLFLNEMNFRFYVEFCTMSSTFQNHDIIETRANNYLRAFFSLANLNNPSQRLNRTIMDLKTQYNKL